MKVLLINPPVADFTGPTLSLPALTAVLKNAGHHVVQKDLNIEAIDYFLDSKRLQNVHVSLKQSLNDLSTKNHLSTHNRKKLYELFRCDLSAEEIIDHIDDAKKNLRDPAKFFDILVYRHSYGLIINAMLLVSSEFYPTRWLVNDLYIPNVISLQQMVKKMENEDNDLFSLWFRNVVVPDLLSLKPDLIGISVTYFSQLAATLTLSRLIKESAPSTFICLGGAALTRLRHCFVETPEISSIVDGIIIYEGETALSKLCNQLEMGYSLKSAPNFINLRDSPCKIPAKIYIEDINSLPCPDYTGLLSDKYLAPSRIFLISTSRGCYWRRCAFCTISEATNSCYRERGIDKVIEDIETLKQRHSAEYFWLADDALSPKRAALLSEHLLRTGLSIQWQCETRLDKGYRKINFANLAAAGCRRLMFGLESSSQRVLDKMQKGIRTENIIPILKQCRRYGIAADLLTFIGFPSETHGEAEDTVQFLIRNADLVNCYNLGSFILEKDSPIDIAPQKYSVKRIYRRGKHNLSISYRYNAGSGISQKQAIEICRSAHEELERCYPWFQSIQYGNHIFLYLAHNKLGSLRDLVFPWTQPLPDDFLDAKLIIRSGQKRRELIRQNGIIFSLVYNTNTSQMFEIGEFETFLLNTCNGTRTVDQIASHVSEAKSGDDRITLYYRSIFRLTDLFERQILDRIS